MVSCHEFGFVDGSLSKSFHFVAFLLVAVLSFCSGAVFISDPGYFGESASLIDFDDLTPDTALAYYQGVTFSSESEEHLGFPNYADPDDVHNRFDSTFWVMETFGGGGAPVSMPNYAAGICHNGYDESDMRFDFDVPQKAIGMWVIDNDFSDLWLRVFDYQGNLLGTVPIPRVSEGGTAFHGIALDTAEISYAIIDEQNGDALDSTFIDDLYYEVPEPVTIIFITLGGFIVTRFEINKM